MNFGDRILLAIKDGKSSVVFAGACIQFVSGLSAEECKLLADKYQVEVVDEGGDKVDRGCGEYITGPTFSLSGCQSIAELVDTIEPAKEKGKIMIGGYAVYTTNPEVRLKSITFRQGFREFDYVRYKAEVERQAERVKTRPVPIKGQYFPQEIDHNVIEAEARFQEVKNYTKK